MVTATLPRDPTSGARRASALRRVRAPRRSTVALAVLVLFYLVSTIGFALATPYGEAPDEFAHLLYIEHLVRFGTLPPIARRFYTNEAVQPPLYYVLNAMWIGAVRQAAGGQNRHAALAPAVQGNPHFPHARQHGINALLHPPAHRWLPWVYGLRLVSILLGVGFVLLTYATARTLVPAPAPAAVPLLAAAFAALIPEVNSIRASISNENLADLLGAWILFLLVRHLAAPYHAARVFWIGVALGLGLLTKLTLVVFVLPALVVLVVRGSAAPRRLARDLLGIGVLVVALAGPFYLGRWLVYGDPLATAAWRAMIPSDRPGQLARQIFWLNPRERWFLWTSFWGRYGWLIIPLPVWIYMLFGGVTLAALGGLGVLLYRRALSRLQRAGGLLAASGFVLLLGIITLYSDVVFQAREMFPALSGICLLLAAGLAGLVVGPRATQPHGTWSPARTRLAAGLLPAAAAGLLAVNLYSILWLVGPLLSGD